MEDDIKYQITTLLRGEIQGQLNIRRPARTYDGRYKPVSGRGGIDSPASKKSLTGNLSQSVQVYFRGNLEDNNLTLFVDFGNVDYWYYVDQGRKPGKLTTKTRTRKRKDGKITTYDVEDFTKYPPLSSILQWVRQRPALQGAGDVDTRAYLASRSIAQYGIYGINFIDKALENIEDQVLELYGDLGQEIFLKIIDKKIILPTQRI